MQKRTLMDTCKKISIEPEQFLEKVVFRKNLSSITGSNTNILKKKEPIAQHYFKISRVFTRDNPPLGFNLQLQFRLHLYFVVYLTRFSQLRTLVFSSKLF